KGRARCHCPSSRRRDSSCGELARVRAPPGGGRPVTVSGSRIGRGFARYQPERRAPARRKRISAAARRRSEPKQASFSSTTSFLRSGSRGNLALEGGEERPIGQGISVCCSPPLCFKS